MHTYSLYNYALKFNQRKFCELIDQTVIESDHFIWLVVGNTLFLSKQQAKRIRDNVTTSHFKTIIFNRVGSKTRENDQNIPQLHTMDQWTSPQHCMN